MVLNKFSIKDVWLERLCYLAFILNFIAFYPGFISPDTLAQYEQALSNSYDTWHPPIMAFTWHILNKIHQGPPLMLAMQMAMLWTSCYLIASCFKQGIWRLVILLVFLLAPFIQNFSGWIVKDTIMALSWLLASAILFKSFANDRQLSWPAATLAALLLIYGTWMRYNAITALPPLCVLWAWASFKYRGKGVKIAACVALLFITHFGQNFFNNVVVHATKSHTDIQIYFHDIAGVFVRNNKNFFPEDMYTNKDFDTAYIRSHYNPIDVTKVLWNEDGKNILLFDKESTESLRGAWLKLIKEAPSEYLSLRSDIYLYFLNVKKAGPMQYWFPWIHPNQYGFHIHDNAFNRAYTQYMDGQGDKIYFQVWFWILLNVLLFPAALIIKSKRLRFLLLGIVSSGFLYTLPQFVVANTVRDFRYVYWACLACIIALFILILDKTIKQPDRHTIR